MPDEKKRSENAMGEPASADEEAVQNADEVTMGRPSAPRDVEAQSLSTKRQPLGKTSTERDAASTNAAVVTVRPQSETATTQRVPYFLGISAATAGARGICMHLISIPPGAAAEPHLHLGYETAIYLLEGRVMTRYGPGLMNSVINQAGDFLYIPPDVPHQPVNLSSTEPARAIIARNDANEQENVVLYDPNDAESGG